MRYRQRHPIEDLLALGLVETAPDSVGLAYPDRVVEAVLADRAGPADRLGRALAHEPLILALHM